MIKSTFEHTPLLKLMYFFLSRQTQRLTNIHSYKNKEMVVSAKDV